MCGNKPLFTWGADTREEQSPARRLGRDRPWVTPVTPLILLPRWCNGSRAYSACCREVPRLRHACEPSRAGPPALQPCGPHR